MHDADPAVAIWAVLRELAIARAREHFDAAVTEVRLSRSQARFLLELERPLSQRELARCLRFDPSNITALVDALEVRGLVERQPDPTDRRLRRVVPTDAGRQLKAQLQARLSQPPDGISRLSPSDQHQLLHLLRAAFDPAAVDAAQNGSLRAAP